MNCAVCCFSNCATLPLMPLTFWICGPWSFHPTSHCLFLPLWQTLSLIHHITQLMTQGPSYTSHCWGVAGQRNREEGQAMRRQEHKSIIVEAKVTKVNRKQDRIEESGNVEVQRRNRGILRWYWSFFLFLSEQNKRLFWFWKCGFHTADWKASGQSFSETRAVLQCCLQFTAKMCRWHAHSLSKCFRWCQNVHVQTSYRYQISSQVLIYYIISGSRSFSVI